MAIAPPTSRPGVLLVANSPIMRGQSSPVYAWISDHPYLFYAGVAAAIVVPLVVINGSDDEGDATPASPTSVDIMSQQTLPPASP